MIGGHYAPDCEPLFGTRESSLLRRWLARLISPVVRRRCVIAATNYVAPSSGHQKASSAATLPRTAVWQLILTIAFLP